MKIIAHRANLNGPNLLTENQVNQIKYAISQGFDCEIDLWYIDNQLFLGHDKPQNKINIGFLLDNANKLWCHCKHLDSLQYLLKFNELNCFYHQTDDYVLTSKNNIWVYPGKKVPSGGIVVMPEWHPNIKYDYDSIGGICTDYPTNIQLFMN